jgi:hypothetical protein
MKAFGERTRPHQILELFKTQEGTLKRSSFGIKPAVGGSTPEEEEIEAATERKVGETQRERAGEAEDNVKEQTEEDSLNDDFKQEQRADNHKQVCVLQRNQFDRFTVEDLMNAPRFGKE